MKRNQHQVTSKSSRPIAAPQPKTAHSRAGDRPASASPCIALFPEGDGGASEEIIHLSKDEYAELKRAAATTRDGALMFMAKAGLEKARWPGRAGNTPSLHGIKAPLTLAEPPSITGGIVVKLTSEHGTELGTVKIDDGDAELLQKAAAASELKLTELLHFIVLRQLEAFFPPGVEWLYRVSDNTLHEISSGFDRAERDMETLWAVAIALVERAGKVRGLMSPADYCTAISELKGLSAAIKELAHTAHIEVSDANAHWKIAGRPALLEQHVAPISIHSAQVAQPNDRRRAA